MIRMKAGSLRYIDLGKMMKIITADEVTTRPFMIHAVEHRSDGTYVNGHRLSPEVMIEVGTNTAGPACGHEHKKE